MTATSGNGKMKKILIVDDERDICTVLKSSMVNCRIDYINKTNTTILCFNETYFLFLDVALLMS
ncbi:MAG: hypothetical protein WBF33_25360 [Candidatus Nitrosopolaris sp.]|jgi:hypothetical protein